MSEWSWPRLTEEWWEAHRCTTPGCDEWASRDKCMGCEEVFQQPQKETQ